MALDKDGDDVDLFISVLDGRFPISEDFDFASTNLGPDSITVSSKDLFFNASGYNKSNGILFMVGIKAITPNVSYSLMM